MKKITVVLGALLALALIPAPGAAQDMAAVAEGARLYGQTCVRCHSARSPTERLDREWVTIVNHMRARANLTKTQARTLTAFLQFTNVPESTPAPPVVGAQNQAPTATDGAQASVEAEPGRPVLPNLVVVDLTDPRLGPEARAAVRHYLRRIGGG